jgi:hypothetical protein
MSKRTALLLLGLLGLLGCFLAMHSYFGTARGVVLLNAISMVLNLLLLFFWLHADEKETGYRRSRWLNVGIVLLAPVFFPYYLYRARPAGRRLRAFGFLVLALLAWLLLNVLGAVAGYFVFQPGY